MIINGREHAKALKTSVKSAVTRLERETGRQTCLATVLVGDSPASAIYVRNKIAACGEVGIVSRPLSLPESAPAADILDAIETLNMDARVNGILLQLPLPTGCDTTGLIMAIDPAKDVDGLHPLNQGLLAVDGSKGFAPCTPAGCLRLIRSVRPELAGLNAVVIGCSRLVGHPMADLLLGADCTVTIAHSKSRNIAALARTADILVSATGVAGLVKGDWVRPGAIVIDVGIIRQGGKLTGDVAFDEVSGIAGAITPVPGGVGPMTIACLLANTVLAAYRQADLPPPAELFP